MTRRIAIPFVIAAAAALTAPDVHAGSLNRYKDWASTPEAYYLSKDERAKWATVDSDEAAEAFVTEYRASRGKGFAAAIQSRISFADKSFTVGKKHGSETLRGRALIVLGPPTRIVQGVAVSGKSKEDPAGGDITGSSGGGDRGPGSVGNAYSNAGGPGADTLRGMQPTTKTVTWSWIYDESTVPPALKAKDLTLEFVVDQDGKESAKEPEKLEQMLTAVVEYWRPKKP